MNKPLWDTVKENVRKVLVLNDSVHGIALGFAIGLFLSVLPTFGIGMVAALALCPVLKINPVSTYAGTLLVNPFTGIFVYGFNYWVGTLVIKPGNSQGFVIPKSFSGLLDMSWQLVIGSFVNAIILFVVSYYIVSYAMQQYRKRGGNNSENTAR
ncbi:MAG: DUF2062 domain-containing protein [Elusimicrobiota bacterium]